MRLPANRRDRLQIAIVINQLATPGLGSWIAGHRIAGAGQLTLAIAGFLYFLVNCIRLVTDSVNAATQGNAPPPFPEQAVKLTLLLFGIAWLWSGITSLQLWRELRNTPPVLR